MLHSLLFFLALVSLSAHANMHPEVFHDGRCPSPPAAARNLQLDKLTGRWLAFRSNYELLKHSRITKQCIEIDVTTGGDDYYVRSYFRDSSSNSRPTFKKFIPTPNHPGSYSALKKMLDGSYSPLGWTYTIVKFQGNSLLEYACKNTEPNKHKVFYRSYARSIPLSQKDDAKLMKFVKNNGDEREMLPYKHENCEYKLT